MRFPLWWTAGGMCACPKRDACGSPGKHPLTANGVKDATDDPAQLQAWRERYPLANWGIATGARSGLVVVDLDIKPGKDGRASLKALGTVPRTRVIRTGSGGLHLYFQHPGGYVPNSGGKLGLGIDVRGDGGYVVAPGSSHISGGTYTVAIDAEPAPLPAWLLARPAGNTAVEPAAAPRRGFFPAAPPEVLQRAREALEAHGPAIEGQGGDLHTFRAAALLVHDYALTDAEAWPLLAEWNAECRPPWSERDLRAKLHGGGKYGKAEYGCARPTDVLAAVTAMIRAWQEAGAHDNAISGLVDQINTLGYDSVQLSVIERDLNGATGLPVRAMRLHKPRADLPDPKPGEILVTTRPHEVADISIRAIAPYVFARGGVLCEVVTGGRAFINDLEPARIVDLMSRSAVYIRADEQKGAVHTAPPDKVASILHSRRDHPVRPLESVTTAPIFLADGSILQERGYNASARVYLDPSVIVDVPDAPTRTDARRALTLFRDLVGDYRFASDADFSSWLAAVLTPLIKTAINNAPAPLVCISASSAGAGKSLLAEVIARIVTGGPAEMRPYNPKDPAEWGKRLTAFVKAASPVNVLDNCNGTFGDDALNRLITSQTWSDRLLGASEAPPLPVVGSWIATGNNIEPDGDTIRRVLMCRLEVDTERPQERTGFKRPLLADYAQDHRAEYLAAALTLLRAYHVAGRPDQNLPPWGSFTAWSAIVRGALVWAGAADPFLTQQRASAELTEPENDAHDFWIGVISETDGLPASVVALANSRGAREVLGSREDLTTLYLRRFVNRFVDKPRSGKRIRRLHDPLRYVVEAIS
jgi:hypothetical protein